MGTVLGCKVTLYDNTLQVPLSLSVGRCQDQNGLTYTTLHNLSYQMNLVKLYFIHYENVQLHVQYEFVCVDSCLFDML